MHTVKRDPLNHSAVVKLLELVIPCCRQRLERSEIVLDACPDSSEE